MISQFPTGLLYHKVTPRWEAGITWITPKAFHRQMEAIKAIGWQTILPDQIDREPTHQKLSHHSYETVCPRMGNLMHVIANEVKQSPDNMGHEPHGDCFTSFAMTFSDRPASGNPFLLFFDDGYECIYRHAFPILEEIGFKACVFIPSGYIGRMNDWDHQLLGRRFQHLNGAMLKELAEAGWMIGSHCVTHCSLPSLKTDGIRREIHDSRQTLQDLTGRAVTWISFPFGRYDQRCIDLALEAGYQGAITPVLKPVSLPDHFRLVLAQPVYLWHTARSIDPAFTDHGSILNDIARQLANRLNYGTVLWKSLLRRSNSLKT